MRIVLDTNVLISAILFPGGAPENVLRLAIEGRVELVASTAILTEFARVLTEKFGHADAQARERVRRIVAVAFIAKPRTRVREVVDDPDDDRILEAALASDATMIVSGEKHLLRIGSWRDIRILRPAECLAEFESRYLSYISWRGALPLSSDNGARTAVALIGRLSNQSGPAIISRLRRRF